MSVIDNILERLEDIETRLLEIEDALRITEPEEDIEGEEVEYPDCDCEDVCEECDAKYDVQ